jgi:hypothetical protein
MNTSPLERKGPPEEQLAELQDRFEEHLQEHQNMMGKEMPAPQNENSAGKQYGKNATQTPPKRNVSSNLGKFGQ